MIYYQFKKNRLNCRNTIYKTIYCFLFTRKSSVAVRCTMLSWSIIPVIDLRVDRQKFDLLGFFNVSKPMVFQQKHAKRWTPIICSRNNIIYVSLSLCFFFFSVNSDLGYYVIDQACNVSTPCTELSPITNCVQARHSSDLMFKAVCPGLFLNRTQIDFKITGRKFTSVYSRIIHKTIDCSSGTFIFE